MLERRNFIRKMFALGGGVLMAGASNSVSATKGKYGPLKVKGIIIKRGDKRIFRFCEKCNRVSVFDRIDSAKNAKRKKNVLFDCFVCHTVFTVDLTKQPGTKFYRRKFSHKIALEKQVDRLQVHDLIGCNQYGRERKCINCQLTEEKDCYMSVKKVIKLSKQINSLL